MSLHLTKCNSNIFRLTMLLVIYKRGKDKIQLYRKEKYLNLLFKLLSFKKQVKVRLNYSNYFFSSTKLCYESYFQSELFRNRFNFENAFRDLPRFHQEKMESFVGDIFSVF